MAVPKKNSNHHKQKTVSFRLPNELMEQLRSLAKKNRRTLSGELQVAIEAHLCGHGFPLPSTREGLDGKA